MTTDAIGDGLIRMNWDELVQACASMARAVIDEPMVDPAVIDDMAQDMAEIAYALQVERRRRSRVSR